jgi:hypothetical protein
MGDQAEREMRWNQLRIRQMLDEFRCLNCGAVGNPEVVRVGWRPSEASALSPRR